MKRGGRETNEKRADRLFEADMKGGTQTYREREREILTYTDPVSSPVSLEVMMI